MVQGESHIATESLQLADLTNSFSMEGRGTPCDLQENPRDHLFTGEESWVTFANSESWRLHIYNTLLAVILSYYTSGKTIALGMLCLMWGESIILCLYNCNYSKEQCQYVVTFFICKQKNSLTFVGKKNGFPLHCWFLLYFAVVSYDNLNI